MSAEDSGASCAGAVLVVFSQRGFAAGAIDGGMLIGVGLALMSSAAMIITRFIFPWSAGCADALLRERRVAADRMSVDIFCLCAALILVDLGAGAINVVAGLAIGEPLSGDELRVVAVAGAVWDWEFFLGGSPIYSLAALR